MSDKKRPTTKKPTTARDKGILGLAKEQAEADSPNYRAIIIRFRDDIASALEAGYRYKDAREALHKILAEEALEEGRKPIKFTTETFRKWCRAEDLVPKPKSQTALGNGSKRSRKTPANAETPEDESTAFKHSATPDTAEIYGSDK